MSERYVVIMAGGSGTRFWPASRKKQPKQFLSIGADRSLLRQTAERVVEMVGWDHLLVVTAEVHARHAQLELAELPEENLLIEPEGRNTAPCIAWATAVIHRRAADAVVAVLPADHFIADPAAFRAHLETALAEARPAEGAPRIVLLGLVPTRPETGYGYIQAGEPIEAHEVRQVARFVEKPDRETAERYLAEGGYLWNSGMFIFHVDAMRTALAEHLPELATKVDELVESPRKLKALYPELPSVSIDYGVMEKAAGVVVLPSNFPWSDVGSWDAAHEIQRKDAAGNVALGDALLIDAKNVLVDARAGRLVAVVGVEELVVVDTVDALLVIPRGRAQAVKAVVDHLRDQERDELI